MAYITLIDLRGDKLVTDKKDLKKVKYFTLIFLLISSFIILSCTTTRFTPRLISHMIPIDTLTVYQQYDKVSYHPHERTFFCMLRSENSIYIYKNDVFFNKIGGSGFSFDNFRNLSDITVGIDGFLYALDSFERSIKRFDRDGKYQSSVNISQINSPTRFAFSHFGFIFVYDNQAKEVHSLDSFDFTTKFSFGKFQLSQVEKLFVCGDFLNIYDILQDQTFIYLINGKFDNSYSGLSFYEPFKNLLVYDDKKMIDTRTQNLLFDSEKEKSFNKENDFLIFFDENKISVHKIRYKETQ